MEKIKDFSALGDSFEEPVKTYSSGMRSRLGFTTALMTDVDILLIDEILSVGDAEFKRKAEKAMKERISGDQTVVFVSHMADHVKRLCSRAIWLLDGSIEMEGPAAEVVDAYQSYVDENRESGRREQSRTIEALKNAETK